MRPVSTKRLTLRPLEDSDSPALYAAIEASRDALKRRLRWVGAVTEPQHARDFIAVARAAGAAAEAAVWGVFEAKGGQLVGVMALLDLLRAPGVAKFSGWIRLDRQQRGYFYESAKALLAQALKGDALHRVTSRIDPSNRPARHVLLKLGFKYEGRLRRDKKLNNRWIDQECWGLLKEEWKKS